MKTVFFLLLLSCLTLAKRQTITQQLLALRDLLLGEDELTAAQLIKLVDERDQDVLLDEIADEQLEGDYAQQESTVEDKPEDNADDKPEDKPAEDEPKDKEEPEKPQEKEPKIDYEILTNYDDDDDGQYDNYDDEGEYYGYNDDKDDDKQTTKEEDKKEDTKEDTKKEDNKVDEKGEVDNATLAQSLYGKLLYDNLAQQDMDDFEDTDGSYW